MWLLSTDRAELRFFTGPENVPDGGYAILSHVWVTGEEQTFQDLQDLRIRCAEAGANPRDFVCSKIQECCKLAERQGYKWLWLDTCCIDKTSSSELSEAINSMFHYYALAEVCYAYLRDVPSGCSREEAQTAFGKSKWHTRGWTLQELIAPVHIIFLAHDWTPFGDKWELAEVLETITGVTANVLRFELTLDAISVAHRLSWAAGRQTTRIEDEAYCLMGLFGVHMPTLYGEGRQAFQRLQEEIMKYSIDTSLLAWGTCVHNRSLPDDSRVRTSDYTRRGSPERFCFAPSPSAFRDCKWIHLIPHEKDQKDYLRALRKARQKSSAGSVPSATPYHLIPRSGRELPDVGTGFTSLSITPFGMLVRRVPVIKTPKLTLAMLSSFRAHGGSGFEYGLLLQSSSIAPDGVSTLYYASTIFETGNGDEDEVIARHVLLSRSANPLEWHLKGQTVIAVLEDIYIAHTPLAPSLHRPPVINRSPRTPIRLPERNLRKLQTIWGFELHPNIRGKNFWSKEPWSGMPTQIMTFIHPHNQEKFQLVVGQCRKKLNPQARGQLWVCATSTEQLLHPHVRWSNDHSCPADHISEWPRGMRTWGDDERTVCLSIVPWGPNPTGSAVIDVALGGSVFLALQQEPLGGSSAQPSSDSPDAPPAPRRTVGTTSMERATHPPTDITSPSNRHLEGGSGDPVLQKDHHGSNSGGDTFRSLLARIWHIGLSRGTLSSLALHPYFPTAREEPETISDLFIP